MGHTHTHTYTHKKKRQTHELARLKKRFNFKNWYFNLKKIQVKKIYCLTIMFYLEGKKSEILKPFFFDTSRSYHEIKLTNIYYIFDILIKTHFFCKLNLSLSWDTLVKEEEEKKAYYID